MEIRPAVGIRNVNYVDPMSYAHRDDLRLNRSALSLVLMIAIKRGYDREM